ncbi:MAG TPA: hypothetical protein VME68_13795 [Acidobacteriaceae bacterium]|nr:hypothetical protein [Acidobacteriaceae bacterium]
MAEALLQSLHPDCDRLLPAISAHISDDMLREIAEADAEEDVELHLAALLAIRDEARFDNPLGYSPAEVLELMRNSVPDDPGWKPGSPGIRGHWMRAFASAALLRAALPPCNYGGDAGRIGAYTLCQLLFSLHALPFDFTTEAIQFVAWRLAYANLEGDDLDMLYDAVALLWLTLQALEPPADEVLVALCEWIVLREAQLARSLPGEFDKWLLGICGANSPPTRWQEIGNWLRDLSLAGHSEPLRDWVHLIGAQLAE